MCDHIFNTQTIFTACVTLPGASYQRPTRFQAAPESWVVMKGCAMPDALAAGEANTPQASV
jgi:hypothetical protein